MVLQRTALLFEAFQAMGLVSLLENETEFVEEPNQVRSVGFEDRGEDREKSLEYNPCFSFGLSFLV